MTIVFVVVFVEQFIAPSDDDIVPQNLFNGGNHLPRGLSNRIDKLTAIVNSLTDRLLLA